MKIQKRYIILLAVASLVIALDQLLKIYVHLHYQLGESTTVIPGFFNITYVRNFGAAFGFLSQTHPEFRNVFFLAMPPIALVIILLILRGVSEKDYPQIFSLAAVFGGAIGNYIDRIQHRYVIDFLDFHWKESFTWPAFNIADMAIVGGVAVLLVLMFMEGRSARKLESATPEQST